VVAGVDVDVGAGSVVDEQPDAITIVAATVPTTRTEYLRIPPIYATGVGRPNSGFSDSP
jgi:hypothetical protein